MATEHVTSRKLNQSCAICTDRRKQNTRREKKSFFIVPSMGRGPKSFYIHMCYSRTSLVCPGSTSLIISISLCSLFGIVFLVFVYNFSGHKKRYGFVLFIFGEREVLFDIYCYQGSRVECGCWRKGGSVIEQCIIFISRDLSASTRLV